MRSRHRIIAAFALALASVLAGRDVGHAARHHVPAAAIDGQPISQITAVGVHNAYDRSRIPRFADALTSGAGLVELDVWATDRRWRVSHERPRSTNHNNCSVGLRGGALDQDLAGCLGNIRDWHAQDPDHPLLVVKVEMKSGFDQRSGLGPAQLDELIAGQLGDIVYKPADLLGGTYADLDAAARAGNWPTRRALRGKVLFELIPGTFELRHRPRRYWTDTQYADSLRARAYSGTIEGAMMFPAVLGAAAGDPRTRYAEASRRRWFVVFDGNAAQYIGGIDTAWYSRNHYLLIMTRADAVTPAIDPRHPGAASARARITRLAAAHASLVTSDWTPSTGALTDVLPRAGG